MLRPLVGVRFQELFHSPARGPFHLSLTVLVHYRSLTGVFSLAGWARRIHTGLLVSRATQESATLRAASCKGLSPSMARLSSRFHSRPFLRWRGPTTPTMPRQRRFGLFPGRSPLLGESFIYFLFLRVLRCFSSPRSPPASAG